jgi:X-X-X-Leu-X-X-Gly heptad repeat protein
MAINPMLPMVFLLSERENRRRDVADALLPALLPIPAASRVAVTAIVADTSVRRQEAHADQVAEQAIQAATSTTLTTESLNQMNRLAPVLARRPDLRDQLLERAAFGETLAKVVASLGENGAVDLESEEFKPLRARVSSAHWDELTAALHPAPPAAAGANGAGGGEQGQAQAPQQLAQGVQQVAQGAQQVAQGAQQVAQGAQQVVSAQGAEEIAPVAEAEEAGEAKSGASEGASSSGSSRSGKGR